MATSPFLGYTSTDTHEGLSWALEGYLNDYGIARMGQALYKKTGEKRYKEESEYFLNRAQDYVQPLRLEGRLLPGPGRRRATGGWTPSKYDPRVWGYDYTETNGWGYAFTAPQDSRGLANLYGGRGGLGGEARHVLRDARRRPRPEFVGLVRRGHPRDDGGAGRPDGHVRALQPGRPPRQLHVRRGRAALEDPGEGPRGPRPGSTPAARSARATTATRTTASSRPGTCSPRSASTRW